MCHHKFWILRNSILGIKTWNKFPNHVYQRIVASSLIFFALKNALQVLSLGGYYSNLHQHFDLRMFERSLINWRET